MKKLLLAFLPVVIYFNVQSQIITTVAGNGTQGNSGDGGPATSAQINLVYFTAIDAAGNLYISDYSGNAVRKISTTGIISLFAGTGNGGYTGDGGPATSATLNRPIGLAFDKEGNLYIGDAINNVIRKVDTHGIITTVVGTGGAGHSGDGGPATAAQINAPNGVAVDSADNLFICDYYSNCIRKVTKSTGIITTVAGTGAAGFSGDGGQATAAKLITPISVAVDDAGDIIIGDGGNNRMRKVNANGIITTIIGNAGVGFSGDGGQASLAKIGGMGGVYIEQSGSIIFSDYGNDRIRKIAPDGIITTIAGNGVEGYSGDGGPATSAALFHPVGVMEDKEGNMYIADRENFRVRKVTSPLPPTISSFSPTSGGNGTTVIITGTHLSNVSVVNFGGTAAKSFTINSATKITAKVGTGATGAVSVISSGGTASKSGFTYCLTPSVKIVSDIKSPICADTVITFTATPQNGGATPVYQWQKNGANVGTNSATYADSSLQSGDIIQCVLTSNAASCLTTNNVYSNAITFTVNPGVTPTAVITATHGLAVCAGGKIQFSAAVTNGGTSPIYQWRKNGTNVGSNSADYTDSAPASANSISLLLTSNAACPTPKNVNSNVLAETVDVPKPVIKIAADRDTAICNSTKVTFTATVTPSYLWKKNGQEVGANSNKYVDSTLKTSDDVQCFLVSSATACNGTVANIINSNILEFTVKGPPAKPSAISAPSNVTAHQIVYFSVTNVAGITYAWTLPSGALIDSGQGSSKIKVTWGTLGGTVSVIAINGCGSSAPRQMQVAVKASLTTQNSESAVKKALPADDDIHLAPNPASTFATLTFAAKTQDKYVITITDAQNKVMQVKNVVSIKGQNQLKLNTTGFAKGTYFITLSNKVNGTKSKQLIIGE